MESVALAAKDIGDISAVVDDDAFWFELGEQEKASARPMAEAMVRDGVAAMDETFGLRPQVGFAGSVDRAIRKQVDNYLDDWWQLNARTERNGLRAKMTKLAAGEFEGGFQEFRRSVEDLYGTTRGRMIAETETTRLWAMGNEISMQQAGVAKYAWRTANDDRVDADCAKLADQEFPVGGNGPRPPFHPRCRCAIIPVPPELDEAAIAPHEGPIDGPPETEEEKEERERKESNAAMMARFNASRSEAAAIPSSDGPIDLHGLRPATGTRGLTKIRADALNRVISRNMAAMPPTERALIVTRSRQMRVGGVGKNSGANYVDGSIRFHADRIDDAVKVYADNPALLTAEGIDGIAAREGYALVEHELTHSTWTRSSSYNAQANRVTPQRVQQVARQRDLKFVEGDFDLGEIQDILGDSMVTSGRAPGWRTGKRFEEGLTDARTRDRLRLKLIDDGVDVDRAFAMAEQAGAGSYDGFVASMREVADEAIGTAQTFESLLVRFGKAPHEAALFNARFVRGLGSQVSRQDRADALARLFMEKWTVDVGPIAARTATGEVLGAERSTGFYREMVDGFKGSNFSNRFGIGNELNSFRGLRAARDAWTREVASFAERMANANLRPDVDGVLAIRADWASAAELPEDMAFVLERRADVMFIEKPGEVTFQGLPKEPPFVPRPEG